MYARHNLEQDPHSSIRPPKKADEKYLLDKKWNALKIEKMDEVSSFPRKRSLEKTERKQRHKNSTKCFGDCCLHAFCNVFGLIAYAIVLGLLGCSISCFVFGIVSMVNYGKELQDYSAQFFSGNRGDEPFPYGLFFLVPSVPVTLIFSVVFIIGTAVCCFGFIYNCSFSKALLRTDTHLNSLEKVKKYISLLMKDNKIKGGDLYVETFHYELRPSNFSYRYVANEKVVTHYKTIKMKYEGVVDETAYPDFDNMKSINVELTTKVNVKLDKHSKNLRKQLLEQVKKEYQGKDQNIDIFYTPFKIRRIQKPFKFSKKNYGILHSIINNPGTIGLCCFFCCLTSLLKYWFISKFVKVKLTVKKKARFNPNGHLKTKAEPLITNNNQIFLPPPPVLQPTNHLGNQNKNEGFVPQMPLQMETEMQYIQPSHEKMDNAY